MTAYGWWGLFPNGTLRIFINGEMPDFDSSNEGEPWTTAPWADSYLDIASIEVSSGTTSIGARSFNDMKNATNAIIADSVTSIRRSAFGACRSLSSVTAENVSVVEDGAFGACDSLETVILPNVLRIETMTFYQCDNISTLVIPNATFIGFGAFGSYHGNSALKSVEIQGAVYLDLSFPKTCKSAWMDLT